MSFAAEDLKLSDLNAISGEPPEVLDIQTVCDLLQVSAPTLRRWVRLNRMPAPVQLGARRVAFIKSEIAAWIISRPRGFLAAAQRSGGLASEVGPR